LFADGVSLFVYGTSLFTHSGSHGARGFFLFNVPGGTSQGPHFALNPPALIDLGTNVLSDRAHVAPEIVIHRGCKRTAQQERPDPEIFVSHCLISCLRLV
jgi:hypothetical protein